MKNVIALLLWMLFYTNLYSQGGSASPSNAEMSNFKSANISYNIDPFGVYDVDGLTKGFKYSDISGSPFLFGDWRKAILYDFGLHPIATVKVKYNSYSDQIHFLDEKETELVANKEVLKKVVLLYDSVEDLKEIVLEKGYTDSKNILRPHQFVQALNEGKIQLLRQKVNTIIRKDSLFGTIKVNAFSENTFYFLKYTQSSIEKLKKLDPSELFALLPNKTIIESYQNREKKKNKFKNEKDFIDFLNFYNQQSALIP